MIMILLLLMIFSFVCSAFYVADAGEKIIVDRLRGIPLERKPLYTPNKDFTCFDGSATIPWAYVNDDYCDCKDGTDEPGTSACPQATFYCSNLGHYPLNIPSSRVNDMICDCCDGSDEYSGHVKCANTCEELGKKAREEAEKLFIIQKEGWEKKQLLIRDGKKLYEEKQKQAEELKQKKDVLEPKKDDLDMKKKDAEKLENEAKKRHDDKYTAERQARLAEKEKEKATTVFHNLDKNNDGRISPLELMNHMEFDKDLDGSVSNQEATEHLGEEEPDLDHWLRLTWETVKDLFKKAKKKPSAPSPPQPNTETNDLPHEQQVPSSETDEQPELDDLGGADAERGDEAKAEEEEEIETPPYDDETLRLIDIAEKVREDFNVVEKEYKQLDEQLKSIEDFVKIDFGPENEYALFQRQCFEYSDLKYTYKLCLFDKVVQLEKGGSSHETSLGNWGHWSGPVDTKQKYSFQKYTDGQSCWNGPSRSTTINLKCGSENQLLSAAEPSRCEYVMDFASPAACDHPSAASTHPRHAEL